MSFFKESTCTACGRKFFWKIDRPSDGYWDRWKSDDGKTAAAWFLSNNLCWEHAYEKMPEQFRSVIKTTAYSEPETPSETTSSA